MHIQIAEIKLKVKSFHMFNHIRNIIPWTVPLKLLLSSILGILGGAGLLGYLSEYATYYYAIYYGIRPPLEGIPYLKASVTFGSLFLLLTGALIFTLTTFMLMSFIWYIDALPKGAKWVLNLFDGYEKHDSDYVGRLLNYLRSLSNWILFVGCLLFSLISTALIIGFSYDPETENLGKITLSILTFIYFFSISLIVVKPASVWWQAMIVVIAYFSISIYLLFIPEKYSRLLRLLGYGGGLSVQIDLNEKKANQKANKKNVYLLLRTNEALIVYDKESNEINEIPRNQINQINHDAVGLQKLPYMLPSKI